MTMEPNKEETAGLPAEEFDVYGGEQPIDGEQLAAVASDGAYWEQPLGNEQADAGDSWATDGSVNAYAEEPVSADASESVWVMGYTEEGYQY